MTDALQYVDGITPIMCINSQPNNIVVSFLRTTIKIVGRINPTFKFRVTSSLNF